MSEKETAGAVAQPLLPGDPGRLQRSQGRGSVVTKWRAGRTCLDRLHQQGAAKLRFPRPVPGSAWLEGVLINTAGGVTGGDEFSWHARAGTDTRLRLTTQASEKIYRSSQGVGRIATTLELAPGAVLHWLPQETILFDGSGLSRSLSVEMASGCEAILLEALVFGRHGHGEVLREGHFRDRWRISLDGRLVHAEELLLDGGICDLLGRGPSAAGAGAFATIVCIGDRFRGLAEGARQCLLTAGSGVAGAESGVTFIALGDSIGEGKLIARMVAGDGYGLRKLLRPLLELLAPESGLPRTWSL